GRVPARASRTWPSGTWSKTARRSPPSSSSRSSNSTRSDKDRLLTAGVGQSETAVVVEAPEPLGDPGLRGLGVVEAERPQAVQREVQRLGRDGRQGAQDTVPHRAGGAGQGQGPGRGVLVVERFPDLSIVHPRQVVEGKSEASQTQAVKFLKD